ncbi:MAG: hypothetical protein QM783_12860 [Phycisphaerales bacterium]
MARFALHLLVLTAAFCSIAMLPLLSAVAAEHFISLKRNKSGTLILSAQPEEGDTTGTVTYTLRTSPILAIDTTTTRWRPAAPSFEELRTAVNKAESDPFQQRYGAPTGVFRLALESLASPTGSVASARLQSGVLVILACAALLIHPARLVASRLNRRPKTACPQTPAGSRT